MRGKLDMRDLEDVGENTLSFAEVKAISGGNPLILEKSKADHELSLLKRLRRAWNRNQSLLAPNTVKFLGHGCRSGGSATATPTHQKSDS
jgi:hypothetical protein